jgi:UDPglucose 6-dehydrogenase
MLKSIAFIGYGFVGKACHKAFEHNTEAIIIDPRHSNIVISDLRIREPPLVFVSINAPTLDDRSVDASVIYNIFEQLVNIEYKGIVVLKSTLPPTIVDDLYIRFGRDKVMNKEGPLRYIYSPEFLRERDWEKDALTPYQIIMAGSFFDCKLLQSIYENHSNINCTDVIFNIVDYRAAALAKYAINSYLASKVVFMNQLYQLYKDTYDDYDHVSGMDWSEFINLLDTDLRIGHSHLDVPGPDGQFGYGGTCFPKDVKAMIGFDKENRLTVLRETELVNTVIRLTGSKE